MDCCKRSCSLHFWETVCRDRLSAANNQAFKLFGFTYSDYAGYKTDKKSTTGSVCFMAWEAVSWKSKKQFVVTTCSHWCCMAAMGSASQEQIGTSRLCAFLRASQIYIQDSFPTSREQWEWPKKMTEEVEQRLLILSTIRNVIGSKKESSIWRIAYQTTWLQSWPLSVSENLCFKSIVSSWDHIVPRRPWTADRGEVLKKAPNSLISNFSNSNAKWNLLSSTGKVLRGKVKDTWILLQNRQVKVFFPSLVDN